MWREVAPSQWSFSVLLYIFLSVAISALIYVLLGYLHHIFCLKYYPPGPFPLPVIGNLHLLRGIPHERLKELSKTYGEVYSLSFAVTRVVIVNGYEAAKEALIEKSVDFAGRPRDLYIANLTTRNGSDIAFADFGPKFKSFRKVVHRSLKMYGDGMIRLEVDVLSEAKQLIERLNHRQGVAVDPLQDISNSVINIICFIVFGHKYNFDDEEFKTVMRFNALFCQGSKASDFMAYFPWLRIFPCKGLRQLKEAVNLRDALLKRKVEEHQRTLNGLVPRDFLDSLLLEAKHEVARDSTVEQFYTNEHIDMILNDVFTGGGETVVTTLRWAIIYLTHNPRIQESLRKEIFNVLGEREDVSLSDRQKMPYMNAFIHEVLRIASVVPLGVPHKTTCPTSLAGFLLPSQTQVFINVWGLHHDEKYWKNPSRFSPERWLDNNGQFLVGNYKSFFPFSAGRRVCLGEALAKIELLVFLTCIVRNFEIQKPDDSPLPTLKGIAGMVHSPDLYKVVFKSVR